MNLSIFHIPALVDNCIYVVVCEYTRQAAVVDPSEAKPVVDFLKNADCKLTAIWNTHHHFDHVGGNEELLKCFPHLAVLGSRYDAEHGRIPGQTRGLAEGDVVVLGDLSFRIWDIPGHTRGHLAFVGQGVAFCGDTLFSCGCGRVFDGTLAELHTSVARLATLPDDYRLYCGHEYTQSNLEFARTLEPGNPDLQAYAVEVAGRRSRGETTLPSVVAREKACNPFFRLQSPEIREKIAMPLGRFSDYDVFAEIRQRKDRF